MTPGVLLVFFTLNIHNPIVTNGPQFSDRIFESHDECAEFVNTIADDGTNTEVVDENYEFEFSSIDGLLFKGGCYTASEYDETYHKKGINL